MFLFEVSFLVDVAAMIILISHRDQLEDIIFGGDGALKGSYEA